MNSEELFRKLLGLEEPWIIKEIKFDHKEKRVDIFIDFPRGSRFPCPVCGIPYGVHDTEERDMDPLSSDSFFASFEEFNILIPPFLFFYPLFPESIILQDP